MSTSLQFNLQNISAGLPLASQLASPAGAVHDHSVVAQAPSGTGKTTLIPPAVADTLGDRVVVTAPRRVAVHSAARRLTQLSGIKLGEEIDYSMHGDSHTSRAIRMEFVIPGVLSHRLLRDGDADADAVLIDEIHGHDLDTGLVLAMVHDLWGIRDDLRLVAMSAAVDTPKFAALLGDSTPAPTVAVEAEIFPLDIRYTPFPQWSDVRGVTDDFLQHVAARASTLTEEAAGDVPVFLPGIREVERCMSYVADSSEVAMLTLHGQQSSGEQNCVLRRQADDRRVIVSTAIAESSATVPGMHAVVDARLARGPWLDIARGSFGLVTGSCAQSSADQRAGRAGRGDPGIVVRCVSQSKFVSFPAWPTPKIEVADLTQALLDAAAWGTPGMQGLKLLDAPPPHHAEAANHILAGLGAVDEAGSITELSRTLATLPVYPCMGRALLAATTMMPQHTDAIARTVEKLTGAYGLAKRVHRIELETKTPANLLPSNIPALVIVLAWPDFIGRRRSADSGGYLFTGGIATEPARGSDLRGQEWIAVADISRLSHDHALIHTGKAIDLEIAMLAADRLAHAETMARTEQGRVHARERDLLGATELSLRQVSPTPKRCIAANSTWLVGALADASPNLDRDTEQLRRRMAFLYTHCGSPWPDVSPARLAAQAGLLLAGELDRPTPPTLDAEHLHRLLPWLGVTDFNRLVPECLEIPSGSKIRLEYPEDPTDEEAQIVPAVELQERFGLTETPQVLEKPVAMHLLSPARRPLAVTGDSESFQSGACTQVRSETWGRYPKHPWPENP